MKKTLGEILDFLGIDNKKHREFITSTADNDFCFKTMSEICMKQKNGTELANLLLDVYAIMKRFRITLVWGTK